MTMQERADRAQARYDAARAKQALKKNGGETVAIIEGYRPTATRVIAGAVLGGPIGALAGFAFRKKTKNRVVV